MDFETAFSTCPLVAILRGLRPDEAADVGDVLVEAGFTLIEVPMNSPEPLDSIARLAQRVGARAVIGAGTVLSDTLVAGIKDAGGTLVVMPHAAAPVIAAGKALGMTVMPGVVTPAEAFAALGAGADALKLFPAEMIPPRVVKALRAVLPSGTRLLPVGGITPETMAEYRAVGAAGFGLGGALFAPGRSVADIGARARAFIAAWKQG